MLLNKDGMKAPGEYKAAQDLLKQAENVIIFLGGEGMGGCAIQWDGRIICCEYLLDHQHAGKPNNGLINGLAAMPIPRVPGIWASNR